MAGRRWLSFLALVTSAAAQQVFVDTLGWTVRDRQAAGPAVRLLAGDRVSGWHACWKDSVGEIRYNYRPANGGWRWENGVAVNADPRNLGCLDYDISRGRALITGDFLYRARPAAVVFTDTGRGTGVFVETPLPPGFRPALVGAANYGYTKFAALRNDTLFFCSYLGGQRIGPVGPRPAFALAVSKQSGRYGCLWAVGIGESTGRLCLKQTPNNGASWYATVTLTDSVPSTMNRSLLGASGAYDSIRLHVVADFYNGSDVNQSEIWHYCPANSPPWSLVQRCQLSPEARIGDNALAAGRPSIGIDRRSGDRYVVWEQFDPDNPDPLTGLARAGIWAARSTDRGLNWGPPVRLTPRDSTSKRFPYVAEAVGDTLMIICFADRVAGFSENGQGPVTRNPVLCLRVPATSLPTALPEGPTLSGWSGSRPATTVVSPLALTERTVLFDVTGRQVPVRAGLPNGVYIVGRTGQNRAVLVK